MFDLSTLITRFEHVPTELHQFDEKHKVIEALALEAAGKLIAEIPYGQEAEDVVTHLVHAAQSAHAAIDKIETPNSIKVGGKVVSPVADPDPSVASPPEAPGAAPSVDAESAAVGNPPADAAALVPAPEGVASNMTPGVDAETA